MFYEILLKILAGACAVVLLAAFYGLIKMILNDDD